MTFELGITVDQSDPIGEAAACPAPIVQLLIGDPQSWKTPKLGYPAGPEALRDAAESAGVGIYVHAPYVINVASTNNRIRIPSRKPLQQHVSMAARIGARGVIVHGGHVTANDDPEQGYENWFKAVDGLDLDCPILIENIAGGSHAMTRHLDSIARLWEAIGTASDFDRGGVLPRHLPCACLRRGSFRHRGAVARDHRAHRSGAPQRLPGTPPGRALIGMPIWGRARSIRSCWWTWSARRPRRPSWRPTAA